MLCYDRCKISYLDAAYEYTARTEWYNGGEVPGVFSPFGSPGEFGGIKLSKHLLKVIFRCFMEAHEPFM